MSSQGLAPILKAREVWFNQYVKTHLKRLEEHRRNENKKEINKDIKRNFKNRKKNLNVA